MFIADDSHVIASLKGSEKMIMSSGALKIHSMQRVKNWSKTSNIKYYLGLNARKHVFEGLRTTQAQTSLRIRAVWSARLFFADWEVYYLDLLRAKFHISS